MTFEQINVLTIELTFDVLLPRLIDLSGIGSSPAYMLDQDEEKSFYDRIIMDESLVKPSLEILNAELAEYQAELTAIEQARLDEIARIEEITEKFNAISDVRGAIHKAGFQIPNPAIELKRIISENDQERLSVLENAGIEFDLEQAEISAQEIEDKLVDGLVEICLGCVKILMKHNIKNGLSSEQKDEQGVVYVDAFSAIQQWRPGKFLSVIKSVAPDGILVTEEMRNELLAYLTANGL